MKYSVLPSHLGELAGEKVQFVVVFLARVQSVPPPVLVPKNPAEHVWVRPLWPDKECELALPPVCSALRCARPHSEALSLSSPGEIVSCWWEVCLIVGWRLQPRNRNQEALSLGCVSPAVPGFRLRPTLLSVYFWKSLYNLLEIVVKGSRSQCSHVFDIHLKSVHFMLVGPLTWHQAGLYLKQNLKLFVASMCLILKVKLLMLFLFNTLTSCETQTSLNSRQRISGFIYRQTMRSCNLKSSVSLWKSSQVACKANLIKTMYKCSWKKWWWLFPAVCFVFESFIASWLSYWALPSDNVLFSHTSLA